MNIPIIFEDEDILVVDKPSGMTVNSAETTPLGETVQEWAERKLKIESIRQAQDKNGKLKVEQGNEFYNRGGVVHRLDKETSGVLILAKNPESFAELQRQFKERLVRKRYLALTHGKIIPAEGKINIPVGRLPWNRLRFGVVPGGRESVTFYKVLDYYQDKDSGELYSYIEINPKTGRTHQIRVHLQYLGHAIFADFLYAGRKTAKKDREVLGRVFLHASKISFIHPRIGMEVTFESPLSAELESALKRLELKVEN